MTIPIIEASECVTRGGKGKTKGAKYGKYIVAITPHIAWIREEIEKSKDGIIRMKTNDLATEMGPIFVKKNPTSIYWALKYIMFHEGIVVDTGTSKLGDKLLLMRKATDEDTLPPSLNKYLESGEDEEEDSKK